MHSFGQGEQDVIPILEARVDCRRICTRNPRYGSHCEGLFPSFLPKLLGGIQNLLFHARIKLPWHQFSPADQQVHF